MPRHRKRKQETVEFDFGALPIPKRRDNGVERPQREVERITVDEAYSAVEEMFPRRLNIIIDSVLKSQARKSLPPSEDDFFREMERTKIATLNAVRMPRGIYDETDQHKGSQQRTVAIALQKSDVIIPRWRAYVTNTFEDLAQAAWLRLPTLSVEEDQKKPHPLQDTAVKLTDMKSDFLAIVQAQMLETVSIGMNVIDGVIHLNKTGPKQLDIENVLPEAQIRHKNVLVESKFIPVAPLPPTLMSAPEKDDFLKLFKGEHLQAIFTKNLGASTRSRKPSQHTLWNSISSNVPSHLTKLPGLTATSISAVLEIAKDMENLWNGKVFDYSLKRLLTIYFRSHLAPKREIRNMESLSKYGEMAKQKKLERETHTSRNSIRQKITREQ
ncbi:unnamed protein product [Umbelopsis vinacea]